MDHHDASDIPTTRTSSTSTAHAPAHAARPASPLSTLAMKDLPPSLACSLLPAADSRHVVSRVTASLSHRTSSGIAWHRAWTRSADASGRSLALGLRAALAFAVGASSLDVWGNWKGRVRSSGGGQGYEGHPSARFLVAASALTVSAAAAAAPGPQTALARTRMRGSASSIPLPMPTSLASSSPFVVVAARAYSSASTPASAPVVSTSTVTSSSRPLPVPFAPSTRPSTLPPSLAFSLSEEDDADADVDRVALDVPPEVTPLEYVGKITITDRAAERLLEITSTDPSPRSSLRLRVESGGCHGYKYELDLTRSYWDDDVPFSHNGARLVTDPASLPLVAGSTLDFVDELIGSRFVLADNPNESSGCGCGSSFGVKE